MENGEWRMENGHKPVQIAGRPSSQGSSSPKYQQSYQSCRMTLRDCWRCWTGEGQFMARGLDNF